MSFAGYEDDWRPDCTHLGFTDEKLVVGKMFPRIFYVHKKILIAESKKFEEMFNEELSDKKDYYTVDVDPLLFELLMNHFYGTSFRIADLGTLWNFYKLCKDYEVSEIWKVAKFHMKSITITEPEFWELTESGLFSHPLFVDKLREYIAENAEDVISSEKIFTVPEQVVDSILLMDALNIGEYDLLSAVTEWGYRNIEQVNSEKLRKFYKHIRFGTLRSDQMRSFYDCYPEAIDYKSIKSIFWYLHSTGYRSLPEWCSNNHVVRKLTFKREKRMIINEDAKPDGPIDLLD